MYEKCLECKKLGNPCDGPNFIAMSTGDLIAWCNARRKQMPGLTYERIAERTGLSKGTVSGFFGSTHADYRLDTVRPILEQLVGGQWEDSPCADPTATERAEYEKRIREFEAELRWRDDKIQHFTEENKRLREELKDSQETEKEQLKFHRGEIKRKNRVITILAIVMSLALAYIIATLIIDRLDSTQGFYWLESVLHLPQSIIERMKINT